MTPARSSRSSLVLVVSLVLGATTSCGGDAPPAPVPPPRAELPPRPLAADLASAASTRPAYPATRKEDVVDTYGSGGGAGLVVHDPYRWLEDWSSPEVKQWSEAESALARRTLDELPARDALGARIEQLLGEPSPSWSGLQKRGATFFALERRPPKQHPFLVVRTSLSGDDERVLVDPSVLDASGGTSVDWFVPSFDGSRVAVSISQGGSEHGDVHVFEVATGKEVGDVVPQADGGGNGECLAWKKDGSGFFYTRGAAETEKPKDAPGVYQQVWFHPLGKPVAGDVRVVGKGSPAIAQWEVMASEDGSSIVARMQYGDGGEFDYWLLGPSGKWKKVATRADHVRQMVASHDDQLYILATTKDQPKGAILLTSLAHPSLARAQARLRGVHGVMTQLVPTASRLYVVEMDKGASKLLPFPLPPPELQSTLEMWAVTKTEPVELPPDTTVGHVVALQGDEVLFPVASYTQPTAYYRTVAGRAFKTSLAETSHADLSAVKVSHETCASKDGTDVPMTVLSPSGHLGTPVPGRAPTLLYGYGGFGLSQLPRFRPELLAWLEQGGVFAVASIRGGGELGDAWHRDGSLTKKQNVFDDFYACAQRLVETKVTSPEHLAIWGRSNGGLLMGAELTQHPEAFKAVVAQVGIYDMLRVERDANGVFNATEYGSVKDPAQLAALAAYSPYQHVQTGVAYPATLFMTGANDPRVNPYHSRKMVARLQDATSSSAPILLRTSAGTGHGMGSPLHAVIEETIDIDSFLFHELGVTYRAR